MVEKELAEKHLVFKCIAGSRSYGTNTANSDLDLRGVFIAPPEYSIGFKTVEQVECKSEQGEDEVIYDFDKFVQLCMACNPNIIELLFTGPENIQVIKPPFQKLRDNANLFLSTKAKFTFSGYAVAQLKRIKGHHKWINQPQAKEAPSIKQFCAIIWDDGQYVKPDDDTMDYLDNECFLVKTKGEYCFRIFVGCEDFKPGIIAKDETQLKYIDIDEKVLSSRLEKIKRRAHADLPISEWNQGQYKGILLIDMESFRTARKQWKDYWEWKNNRNEQRAELESKYNYDTKHASHLVRLTKMCKEIITTGQVIVRRPDAQELLDIRNGKFDYDELIKWASDMDNELNELYKTSPLPHHVDVEAINKLAMQIKIDYWKEQGLL